MSSQNDASAFSAAEMLNAITDDNFENLLKSRVGQLSEDQASNMRREMSPYSNTLKVDEAYTVMSYTNLSQEYQKRFLLTGLNAFLYRVLGEYEIDGVSKDEMDVRRGHIRAFLDEWLEFDADKHVRSAHDTIKSDPERRVVDPANVIINTRLCEHQTEEDAKAVRIRIPPRDTLHRWQYYMDVNHDELRNVVRDLYCHKPDLELMFNIFTMFKTAGEAKSYQQENEDVIKTDVHTVRNGVWNLCGSFKKNRERIDYYNKQTEVLRMINEQAQKDQELGREMMLKRKQAVKRKNVEKYGPDDPKLAEYTKGMVDLPGAEGTTPVKQQQEWAKNKSTDTSVPTYDPKERTPEGVDPLKKYADADDAECPEDCIPVPVYKTGPNGEFTRTHFYTKADSAEETDKAITIADGSGHHSREKKEKSKSILDQQADNGSSLALENTPSK